MCIFISFLHLYINLSLINGIGNEDPVTMHFSSLQMSQYLVLACFFNFRLMKKPSFNFNGLIFVEDAGYL